MITYELDSVNWDLVVDQSGNFATVADAAQIAQDVASAVRTYLGECWYDTSLGMPYFQSIFGQTPSSSFLRAQITKAAMSIQSVTGATVTRLLLKSRKLTGTILVTTSTSQSPITVVF